MPLSLLESDHRGVREDGKRALVTRLLGTEDWISGPDLARLIGVSTRTLRTYTRTIPGIESSRYGYRADFKVARRWLEEQRPTGPETPLERLYFIIRALLSGHGSVSIFDLADDLFVAPPTLEADLGRARGLLRGHDLQIRRSGDELRIEGPEKAQRHLLREILIDTVAASPVVTIDDFQTAFPEINVQRIRGIMEDNLSSRGLRINPIVATGALLHILITVNRVEIGKPLGVSGDVSDVADGIANDLTQMLGLHFPEGERAYISDLVAQKASGDQPTDTALALVTTALEALSAEFQVAFDDPALAESLVLHVRSLIQRAAKGNTVPNPFTAQIKQSHPLVYELAVAFARSLSEAVGIQIDDDEKAYIAMHLGTYFDHVSPRSDTLRVAVLMQGYRHLPPRVAERLRQSLPSQAEIQIVSSWSEVATGTDLVVTNTAPPLMAVPTICVTPLLSDTDVDQIQHRAGELLKTRRAQQFAAMLDRLLDPELFYLMPSVSSPTELITVVSQDLVALGVAPEGVADSILQRESLSPTAFPSGVAVPHPVQMMAKRSGFAIVCFPEPLKWSGVPVSLVVFLAFSPAERGLFNTMFDQMIEMLANTDVVTELVENSGDFESFRRTMVRLALAQ